MSALDRLISSLRDEDTQGLESLENMSTHELENYIKSVGVGSMSPREARAVISSVKTNAVAGLTQVGTFRAPVSAATFSLNIKRNTAALAFDLPVPLWGSLDRESDYKNVIASLLPVGVTYTVAKSTSGKGLRFTYTDGISTDWIEIECPQVPYLNMLKASNGALFKMSQNKMNISNVAYQTQFDLGITIANYSMFGRNTVNTFTPNDYKTDLQNQNDIRILNQVIDIDLETSLVMMVTNQAFTINLTSFVQKFEVSRSKGI